ncbi:hypothetical protein BHE74_00032152 [Ensete ventricosum]|nr:hypothetical protein BHE74_00032152 [Ensete ventricosum]
MRPCRPWVDHERSPPVGCPCAFAICGLPARRPTLVASGRLSSPRLERDRGDVAPSYEVFNMILQVIAFLSVVPVVPVEATIAPAVTPYIPHWIGNFQEPLLSDLEEDFGSGRIEWALGTREMACPALSVLFLYSVCTLKESVESEESVSGSGRLWIDALGVDIRHLVVLPEGTRSRTIGN